MIKFLDFKSKRKFALTQIIPALLKNDLKDKALKIFKCGEMLNVKLCTNCSTAHFGGSNSCKDKFCPVCQKKRSLLWLMKVIPLCEDLLSRGYYLNMLTFTIRTTKSMSLNSCLDLLYKSYRYMSAGDKTFRQIYNDLILGGVRSLEVKVGEDKNTNKSTEYWHPHFHVLVCTRNKKSYKELHSLFYSMWNKSLNITNGTKDLILGTVNIRSITCGDSQTMVDSLCEIFKYITKFDWQGDRVRELILTMHKKKMLNCFGNFKYLIKEKDIEREMEKTTDEVVKCFCAVCGSSNFVDVSMFNDSNLQLFDLEHKNRYVDVSDNDLILRENMEE